ncbi:hypothetical protein NDU88_005256 [Pleurodeles waltl]|uniref:Reverse transcriptase domain-containing protein n=1 Tax=Pleurodeles waltl TaxID=8319 RepID=A0AAV7TAT6_PLEWA|nr:hypothetical protein NDU88_005256 [Pleurodeles waltl]
MESHYKKFTAWLEAATGMTNRNCNVTVQCMGLLSMTYHVSEHHNILKEYSALFKGLGKLKDTQVTLHIHEAIRPVAQNNCRVPVHIQPPVAEDLRNLLQQDIIEPAEELTTWVSPSVAVAKKNTNEISIYVDMISCLDKACVFSKLDFSKGYHQLELDPQSRCITTFSTHLVLFRYKRLSFGI